VRKGLSSFAEHLFAYQTSIDPDQYLREEFSLIRSAMATQSRETEYLEMERDGRAIVFSAKVRKLTLELLLVWEEVMLSGGVLDELSLAAALLPSRTKLLELPAHLRFRSLLIDEFQDLSTLDLTLLRQIPTASENGFFVAGDPVQRVLVKSLRMRAAGLDIDRTERERITKNYRNSRQILLAASKLANKFGETAQKQKEEIEFLDPELAVRETAPPQAIEVVQGRELEHAWQLARECLSAKTAVPWSINIATASPSSISVEAILASKPANLEVKAARISGDYTRSKDTLTVGTVTDVKGFEFTVVIIVGCGKEQLPVPGRCKDEVWRDALRLYVAMTRGRDQVHLIYSGEPSELLDAMKADLKWESRLPEATVKI
jgi:superfamily I DNA/RNA helicase